MVNVLVENCSYPIPFNTPRYSRHNILCKNRIPLEKLWRPLQTISAWKSFPEDYDLIHAFNGIPLTNKNWIITFEVYLPYLTTGELPLFQSMLRERLALENCRKIIAMSDYAKLRLINNFTNWRSLNIILNKLEVIHPNLPLMTSRPKKYDSNSNLNIVFVGNGFARKGGITVVRLAKKAYQKKLPIHIHIVSSLTLGNKVTDHQNFQKYENDFKLLDLSNVTFHKTLSNKQVIELLSQNHFHILPTLYDTYGYSILESFSVGTPAITTNIAALPEFVHHNQNGYVLELKLSKYRTWHHLIDQSDTNSEKYWELLDATYNSLADNALQFLEEFIERADSKEHYEHLSAGAIAQIENMHESRKVNEVLDNIYSQAMGE
jgi:glycosyltransferase involved in cell wall biosynthesis